MSGLHVVKQNLKEVLEMRKLLVVFVAFSILFFGLTFGIVTAQTTHGLQDEKFTAEQLRDYGATMYGRGKMLKEMGEAMMKAGEEGQKTAPISADKGIPGGPQYLVEKGKMMKEMGEKMMVEGEKMMREAEASLWKEGVPGAKIPPAKK
jgi:hypothetical protein